LRGCAASLPDGSRLCFAYNISGCDKAGAGEPCEKGKHLCATKGCHDKHPHYACPKKSQHEGGSPSGPPEAHVSQRIQPHARHLEEGATASLRDHRKDVLPQNQSVGNLKSMEEMQETHGLGAGPAPLPVSHGEADSVPFAIDSLHNFGDWE